MLPLYLARDCHAPCVTVTERTHAVTRGRRVSRRCGRRGHTWRHSGAVCPDWAGACGMLAPYLRLLAAYLRLQRHGAHTAALRRCTTRCACWAQSLSSSSPAMISTTLPARFFYVRACVCVRARVACAWGIRHSAFGCLGARAHLSARVRQREGESARERAGAGAGERERERARAAGSASTWRSRHTNTYIDAYIHRCIHTCMHACIHAYIHTGQFVSELRKHRLSAFRVSSVRASVLCVCVCACVRACLHACLHALNACMPCMRACMRAGGRVWMAGWLAHLRMDAHARTD